MLTLKYRNNWESHEYTVGKDKEVKTIKKVTIRGTVFKVKSFQDTRTVHDHGHTYDTTSTQFYIEDKTEKLGVKVQINLSGLKGVKVDEKDIIYA